MLSQSTEKQLTNNVCDRQYFLDWVRILAFAFLILYHTAMMFVDWGFHIESGHNSTFLKSIMILSSKWRLDILFIVSGVAISHMITKMSLKSFTWQRVVKLYLPLLFAIAVVVAPQSYYEAMQKGVFEGSFWQFWTSQYFTFSWDERMNAPFPTYNHMWYVLYLFHYSIVLLPLFSFINSDKGKHILAKTENWLSKGARIIWLPLAIYLAIFLTIDDHEVSHAFYDDWYGHAIFIFAVIMGCTFARMPNIWQAFEENRYLALTLGLISYGILLAIFLSPDELLTCDRTVAWDYTSLLVKWSWIALIIGFARKYLNYTNNTLKYCNTIVYPFFILHQTVIIVLGYYVIDWGLSGTLEFLVIAAGTFTVCCLLYELLIKRINVLRVLFGLKWQNIPYPMRAQPITKLG
ncbi:acyltransferase family protein [Colwellia psychrerythraea]|uniref:Acyltransferase 3 n=1 Tax=Colwellia psychrerythraea TaxID=28229 RepID=A0A099KJM2_COLPS|nr:acyltransferase [Colwellia psychrerythraea]KGJ90132.1 acyltransferase 3 [Colwellia psychrerythraea]